MPREPRTTVAPTARPDRRRTAAELVRSLSQLGLGIAGGFVLLAGLLAAESRGGTNTVMVLAAAFAFVSLVLGFASLP